MGLLNEATGIELVIGFALLNGCHPEFCVTVRGEKHVAELQ
jgi:hypothetical protein